MNLSLQKACFYLTLACAIVGYFAIHHAYWYESKTKGMMNQKEVGNMLANCLLDIDSVTCSNSEKGIPLPWEGTNFVITLESGAIVSSRLHHATRYLTLCYETMMLIAVGIYVMTDLCFANTPNHAMLIHITGASIIFAGVFLLAGAICFTLAIGKLDLDYSRGNGIYLCFLLVPALFLTASFIIKSAVTPRITPQKETPPTPLLTKWPGNTLNQYI